MSWNSDTLVDICQLWLPQMPIHLHILTMSFIYIYTHLYILLHTSTHLTIRQLHISLSIYTSTITRTYARTFTHLHTFRSISHATNVWYPCKKGLKIPKFSRFDHKIAWHNRHLVFFCVVCGRANPSRERTRGGGLPPCYLPARRQCTAGCCVYRAGFMAGSCRATQAAVRRFEPVPKPSPLIGGWDQSLRGV